MPRPDRIYKDLLATLRQQFIASYSAGENLPSQRSLALMHGVGQATVHRALHNLAKEGLVRARPRIGWVKAGKARRVDTPPDPRKPLRVGIITRRNIVEVTERGYAIYPALRAEAERRGIEIVLATNPRIHHPTPGRNRIEFSQVSWNKFDLGLLVEIEDAENLMHPLLKERPVLAVDNDATQFGVDSVTFDDYGAGRMAARHLFDLGHRRFSVVDEVNDPGWPCEATWMRRRHGFEFEVGRLGGCIHPQWRVASGRQRRGLKIPELAQSVAASWAVLPAHQRPSALFAVDQSVLESLVPELARRGIHIPRDLSVMTVEWTEPGTVLQGLRFSCIYVELEGLVRRTFDIVEQIARGEIPPPLGAARLYTAPVLLSPGDTTVGAP